MSIRDDLSVIKEFLDKTFVSDIKDRETYMKFRSEWREDYKMLTAHIKIYKKGCNWRPTNAVEEKMHIMQRACTAALRRAARLRMDELNEAKARMRQLTEASRGGKTVDDVAA